MGKNRRDLARGCPGFYDFLNTILAISGKFSSEIGILAIRVNDFKFCVDPGLRIN